MTGWTEPHDRVLWRLEQRELRALSWGQVDGAMTRTELEALANEEITDPRRRDQILDELIDWNLVFDVGGVDECYRSRFAEGVRLLARNRQLLHGRDWRAGAQLVNDFRVVARARSFPCRNIPLTDTLAAIADEHPIARAEDGALRAMLTPGGKALSLTRFQLDATQRIRDGLLTQSAAGTIVSAGTGSGKTRAFYLPALAYVTRTAKAGHWSRVLALYPRNELLKDQLSEALAQVELIAAANGPVLAIGALFGPTVSHRDYLANEAKREDRSGWTVVPGGFACSYLRCPHGCNEDLVWSETDVANNVERLFCPSCRWCSRDGQLTLTRDAIKATPPHILFTTTEMLNRGLADAGLRPVFIGRTADTRPRALLLDEVHTYGGAHGAQVALLLRRWRHALGPRAPLHVVGLSATLDSPESFFAALTGISDVQEVKPHPDDMDSSGAEYGLVLRGNPVSGTALLSTTIQSAFLLARLLESRQLRERSGTSGSRVFAFTDNLDVTNRLYWDLRDAEQGRRGGPTLANLRRVGQSDQVERDREGQIWSLPPRLGWPLGPTDRLHVTRTSSQDAGVDLRADVIVATSSLEVGFDDPEVGGVIQHKAPRDDAAFLQRKGRAGRQLTMRPWTVVVLSDYGKDRLRYQAYETLFAPTMAPRLLPLDNPHVIKMQAACALLDWLTLHVPWLSARADLSQRAEPNSARASRQDAVKRLLRAVLEDPARERELARHVRLSLALTPAQAQAAMWTAPRGLMVDTVPTLLRRLETDWRTVAGEDDGLVRDTPLPEYAPRALFADLNLPEVEISAPRRHDQPPREDRLSVPQAIGEFIPGRASRRYGVRSIAEWHWVPLPDADEHGMRVSDVDDWLPVKQAVGTIQLAGESSVRRVLRPWRIELALAGQANRSANARPRWETRLTASGDPWHVPIPQSEPLRHLLREVGFHTHALGNEVAAVRAVGQVTAEIEGVEAPVELVQGGAPVSVGFVADLDAVRLPVQLAGLPGFADLGDEGQRAVRTAWFEAAVLGDGPLRATVSRFTAGWLVVLYLAALAAVSIADSLDTLDQTVARVRALGLQRCLERALDAIFAVSTADEDDEDRGLGRLRAVLHDQSALDAVDRIATQMVTQTPAALDPFTHRIGMATLVAAIRDAFQRMAPTFDADSLIIDVPAIAAPLPDEIHVWLCEPDVGSGGTIEALRALLSEDPARFARLVKAAVSPADLEVAGWQTGRIVHASTLDTRVVAAFAGVRDAASHEQSTRAQQALRAALRDGGFAGDHAVLSMLNLRVLRPGSSPTTDQVLIRALGLWELTEARLGLEIDARVVAYASSRDKSTTLEAVYSLLWPRGRDARRAGLDAYSRFHETPTTERLVLHEALGDQTTEVPLAAGALATIRDLLARTGNARLAASPDRSAELRGAIQTVLAETINVGSVAGYPRVVGAGRRDDAVTVTFELPEAAL